MSKKYDTLAHAVELLKNERETTNELRDQLAVCQSNVRQLVDRENKLRRERAQLMAENKRLRQTVENMCGKREDTL